MAPSKKGPEEFPPQTKYALKENTVTQVDQPFYQHYDTGVPIAIDMGSYQLRAGLTNSNTPNNIFPTLMARYRERKSNQLLTLVGNDVYRDPLIRSSIKSPFDGSIITNWDYVETIFDYTFAHLNVQSTNESVNNPIIMTEPPATTLNYRKGLYEMLFETYNAPQVTFGIDSLFSYYANTNGKPQDAIVIGSGHQSTHVIPVCQGKGVLSQTKRIDWGGDQSQQFLGKLLALKYPYFPSRLTPANTTNIFQDHCYVSEDYQHDLKHILDMDILESKDIVLQAPVEIVPEKKKSEEEIAAQTLKRREQGKRLQEQAKVRRQEKLLQKQQEYEYFVNFKSEFEFLTPGEVQKRLQTENFDDLSDFNKYFTNLEKSIKKQEHNEEDSDDEGFNDGNIDPLTAWPLVGIPDEQLNAEEIKEKRKQKLHKGNYEARQKSLEDKRREEEERAQYEQEQKEWRERDMEGWCSSKRIELAQIIHRVKERNKLLESFKDRKSMAAQQRMRSIADLANDENGSTNAASRKRRRNANATIDNDPNDTFGANDDDWNAYRDITNVNLEEEQAEDSKVILKLEEELLTYDANFHHEDTLAAQTTFDWKNSSLHKFIHGPRPNISLAMELEGLEQDEIAAHPEIIMKNHQLHVNVERIRVPEILFQPHIAGLDQAGITEVCDDLVNRRLGKFETDSPSYNVIKDVFITGGLSNLPNFDTRIVNEFTGFLPIGAPLRVRKAQDATIDPWKGMKLWSDTNECKGSYVTKAEFEEYGPEYIKEHGLGNVCLME
ncbi:actin-related protein 5 [[Candida] jaroonii]|uniref:Actin-related protein 5 n=1 Tax=[Candida] jaroonii TaxID=467808 RepID=A0ACA9Y5W0_9ASCO|nr:actin-related protein 5 [[Candida] jaroonii]